MGTRSYLFKKHKNTQTNIDGSSVAFILEDFEFRAKGNKRIDNTSIKEVNKATINNIRWRFPKTMIMDKSSHILNMLKYVEAKCII